MQSFNKLPPLKSPTNTAGYDTFEVDGMAKKKLILRDQNKRNKTLAKKRPSIGPNGALKVNFSFATNRVPKISSDNLDDTGNEIEGGEMDISAHSNMQASQKRKIKRTFLRPKASSILGLDKDEPISMQNTISTN